MPGAAGGCSAQLAHLLGASPVGVDFVPETVRSLRSLHPDLRWEVADLSDAVQLRRLGLFDRVAAVEVLQHMDFDQGLARSGSGSLRLAAWWVASPIAFARCGRCQRTACAMDSRLARTNRTAARSLPGCSAAYFKGLTYLEDQTFVPYRASDWAPEISGTPNRIVFAIFANDAMTCFRIFDSASASDTFASGWSLWHTGPSPRFSHIRNISGSTRKVRRELFAPLGHRPTSYGAAPIPGP